MKLILMVILSLQVQVTRAGLNLADPNAGNGPSESPHCQPAVDKVDLYCAQMEAVIEQLNQLGSVSSTLEDGSQKTTASAENLMQQVARCEQHVQACLSTCTMPLSQAACNNYQREIASARAAAGELKNTAQTMDEVRQDLQTSEPVDDPNNRQQVACDNCNFAPLPPSRGASETPSEINGGGGNNSLAGGQASDSLSDGKSDGGAPATGGASEPITTVKADPLTPATQMDPTAYSDVSNNLEQGFQAANAYPAPSQEPAPAPVAGGGDGLVATDPPPVNTGGAPPATDNDPTAPQAGQDANSGQVAKAEGATSGSRLRRAGRTITKGLNATADVINQVNEARSANEKDSDQAGVQVPTSQTPQTPEQAPRLDSQNPAASETLAGEGEPESKQTGLSRLQPTGKEVSARELAADDGGSARSGGFSGFSRPGNSNVNGNSAPLIRGSLPFNQKRGAQSNVDSRQNRELRNAEDPHMRNKLKQIGEYEGKGQPNVGTQVAMIDDRDPGAKNSDPLSKVEAETAARDSGKPAAKQESKAQDKPVQAASAVDRIRQREANERAKYQKSKSWFSQARSWFRSKILGQKVKSDLLTPQQVIQKQQRGLASVEAPPQGVTDKNTFIFSSICLSYKGMLAPGTKDNEKILCPPNH